jgi:hypothetical protein
MLDDLFRQLRSSNPADRQKAIVALANTRDPAAIRPLADVYRTDPDPRIRELALKAGRYLQQQAGIEWGADVQSSGTATGDSAYAGPISGGPTVTARDLELARNYLRAAGAHFNRKDNVRAVENLGRALSLYPALQKDPYVVNMATVLTGRPLKEAVPVLIDPDQRAELVNRLGGKQKLRPKSKGKKAESATWNNILLDLVLYVLVVALGAVAVLTLGLSGMQEWVEEYTPTYTLADEGYMTAPDFDYLDDMSLVIMIPLALLSGAASAVTLLIQAAGIHIAATRVLAGDNTLEYFLRRFLPFQTIVALLSAAATTIMLLLIPSDPGVAVLFWFALAAGGVSIVYYTVTLIADVYRFGLGSGCCAIFLGAILAGVALMLFQCLFTGTLAALAGGS